MNRTERDRHINDTRPLAVMMAILAVIGGAVAALTSSLGLGSFATVVLVFAGVTWKWR